MRIRSILPNFYRSEDVGRMDWDTRLIFIGLWSYVDDNGVGRDVSQLIVADLFPYDDTRETVARLSRGLQALSDGGQIIRYTVANRPYLFVVKMDDYQRIDKPGKERYVRPEHESASIRDTLATPSRDTSETVVPGEGEKGRRGEGEKVTTLSDKSDDFDAFWTLYPRKDAKGKARIAYRSAAKKVTPAVIAIGLGAQIPGRTFEKPRDGGIDYRPLPASWLNAERWADEVQPVAEAHSDQWARAYRNADQP